MKTLDLIQGSPEWHAHRRTHWNASDAPAMLGCSPHKTRTELIKELATGITPEVDAATQRRFDDGHRFEALARPLAEEIIGEDLYPVTGSEGPYSASFDGLTLGEDIAFEHKSLNAELRAAFEQMGHVAWNNGDDAGSMLPLHYRAQMEHQLLVSGAQKVLFMASKWDGNALVEEKHCWYVPDPILSAKIVAGWSQLEADVAAYAPTESAPVAVAAPVEALPAVSVRLDGALAVVSNLPAFGEALKAFIAKLPAKPSTDQEFADTDAACKALKRAEEALEAAESGALAGMAAVEAMRRMVGDFKALARATRLQHEKLVAARKEAIRTELVMQAQADLAKHIRELNAAMPGDYLPASMVPADFAGVIKGKKTVDSIRDALGTELARAKIVAAELANRIHGNVKTIAGSGLMVHDTAQLVTKAPEDLANVLAVRKADQERRENEQRERIRAERERAANHVVDANKMVNVVPMPTKAPAVDTSARIKLGDLNAAIAPLSITADGLAALGFPVVATDKTSKLYRLSDMPAMLAAMVRHIQAIQAKAAA